MGNNDTGFTLREVLIEVRDGQKTVSDRLLVVETQSKQWQESHDERSKEFMAQTKEKIDKHDTLLSSCEAHKKEMRWTRKLVVGSALSVISGIIALLWKIPWSGK